MIILHPYPGFQAKSYANFQELINILSTIFNVLLIGTENDRPDYENVTDLRGKLTLPELAALIKRVGLFIGVDSGPAHLADAQKVKSLIICSGVNIPEYWYTNSNLIYKDVSCKPCDKKECDTLECMQIDPKDIFARFLNILDQKDEGIEKIVKDTEAKYGKWE